MLTNYTINNKKYTTITIPSGTVLFRGILIDDIHTSINIFKDLIGYHDASYSGISFTDTTYFYPVPYISDAVKLYDFHVMYITQYDIELLLLIKPSTVSRDNVLQFNVQDDIITDCTRISNKDVCDHSMSDDPCFTTLVLEHIPQIAGFIAIEKEDNALIRRKYVNFIDKYHNKHKARHIIPAIHSNSNHNIGIPEIAIHPLHFRQSDCFVVPKEIDNPASIVKYCIDKRARYNFFPLLYFTHHGVFTFNEMGNENIIRNIITATSQYKTTRFHKNTITQLPPIYKDIDVILSRMLDGGYRVNGVTYHILVDTRTGFYKLYHGAIQTNRKNNRKNNRNTKRHNKQLHTFDWNDPRQRTNVLLISPKNNKEVDEYIHKYATFLDSFIDILTDHGYSIKRELRSTNNNIDNIIERYHIRKVLDRSDLIDPQRERFNRRLNRKNLQQNNTRKHSQALFDFTQENLNNVSSVNSNFNHTDNADNVDEL